MLVCEPARYVDAMCQRCKPVCRHLTCRMCSRREKMQDYKTAADQSCYWHVPFSIRSVNPPEACGRVGDDPRCPEPPHFDVRTQRAAVQCQQTCSAFLWRRCCP